MKDFLKRLWLPMAAVFLCCGCSGYETEEEATDGPVALKGAEVAVSVEAAPWYGAEQEASAPRNNRGEREAATRAVAGLGPVTLLVVPDGSLEIAKRIAATEGKFNVKLEDGAYDLVAVCGLAADLIGEDYSSEIDVADGTDFAVGATRVVVENGVCSPSVVNITADRQMAWLEVSVTGVPSNIATFELYAKEACDKYALDGGWWLSANGKGKYTRIPLTKTDGVYSGGGIMAPCSSSAGVVFVAEATTVGGVKTTLTYTSKKALASGVHLTQTLAYGDMMVVEGGINVNGWTDESDDGTLTVDDGNGSGNGNGSGGNGGGNGNGGSGNGGSGSGSSAFVPGNALPGYPDATVVFVDGNVVTFVANTPLEGNATYFKGLRKKENYAYASDIPNTRWFIPQYSIEADKDMAEIFFNLLLNNESARQRLGITLEDEDVFAYLNPNGTASYFDFSNEKITIESDALKDFRCFVFGEMEME